MGRRPEGPKVVFRNGFGHARFTHQGRRHFISTGKSDPREAHEEAHRIYAEVVAGRRKRVAAPLRAKLSLEKLFAEWLAALGGVLDEETVNTYETTYVPRFVRFFKRFDAVDEASIDDYARDRLRLVLKKTVHKELGALRGFLRWCKMESFLETLPAFPEFPKTAKGKRSGKQRAKPNKLSEAEVVSTIMALPMLSPRIARTTRSPFVIRPRFVVMYETGLRPATLSALKLGAHWTRGASELRIEEADDKARFGRTISLSVTAVAALEFTARELALKDGDLLFGDHDYRTHLAKAGEAAGITRFAPYDLRHALATHMLDRGASLPGVGFGHGHTQTTTTSKYTHPTRRAHEDAMKVGRADLSGSIPEIEGES